jgi:hypothetical protein
MIETYDIGARLILNDAITGQLDAVDSQFAAIESVVARINQDLGATAGLVSGMIGPANDLAAAFNAAAEAAGKMRDDGGFGGGGGNGGGGGDEPPSLPGGGGYLPWGDGSNSPAVIPGSDSSGPEGWGHTYQSPDEPFNSPSPVPLYPGSDHHSGGMMDAMSTIFVAKAATSMITDAVSGAVSPAFDLQTQLTNLGNNNASPSDVAAAKAEADKLRQENPGMTTADAMSMIMNLYSVDQNMPDVLSIVGNYARDGYIISHAQGKGETGDQLYSILRAGEEAGKLNDRNADGTINTQKFMDLLDLYTKIIVNSNGNATGEGALTMMAQAGPGATQLSDEAIERAAIAAQSLTPSQVRTGLNAMYQEFIGGKMSQATARSLHEAGVLPDYMFGKDGKILNKYKYGIGQVMLPPGTLEDEGEALHDPIQWASQHLFEQYVNSDGTIKKGDEAQVEGLIADLNRDFSRIPGMRLAGNAIFNSVVQDRRMQNIDHLAGLDTIQHNDASTANAQAAGTGAAFNALLIALGSPIIPGATKGLEMLTAGLDEFGEKATANPAETIVGDGIALGAGAWGTLKLLGKLLPTIRLAGAGAAADGVADVIGGVATGPMGILGALLAGTIAYDMDHGGLKNMPTPRNPHAPGAPTGTAGDPLHVKVVNTATHQTSMPTFPTLHLPGQSAVMPGQINR